MNIVEIFTKYFRYLDQAIYSISTLLLSILAPLFFSKEQSAEILYLISFLLLFLAGVSAFFITPILSLHDDSNNLVSKMVKLFLYVAIFITLAIFFSKILFNIQNIYFYYFSLLFCNIELLRRIFIIKNFHIFSFFLSCSMFILIPLTYFITSQYIFNFWKVLFYFSIPIIILGYYFFKKNIGSKVILDKKFLNKIFKIGFFSIGSFVVMWCATQGIFVVFYEILDNSVFVEQKLIFSVLGFFNVVMIVQENKYQPLYAKAIVNNDLVQIKHYNKAVNIESYLLLLVCIICFFIFYVLDYSFYLAFLIFSIYRFLMSISKSNIYCIRAIGKFKYLVGANLIALFIIYTLFLFKLLNVFGNYQIPLYFSIHAFIFFILTYYLKNRGFYAKHWNI